MSSNEEVCRMSNRFTGNDRALIRNGSVPVKRESYSMTGRRVMGGATSSSSGVGGATQGVATATEIISDDHTLKVNQSTCGVNLRVAPDFLTRLYDDLRDGDVLVFDGKQGNFAPFDSARLAELQRNDEVVEAHMVRVEGKLETNDLRMEKLEAMQDLVMELVPQVTDLRKNAVENTAGLDELSQRDADRDAQIDQLVSAMRQINQVLGTLRREIEETKKQQALLASRLRTDGKVSKPSVTILPAAAAPRNSEPSPQQQQRSSSSSTAKETTSSSTLPRALQTAGNDGGKSKCAASDVEKALSMF